jgi:hypothetical protein
MINRIEVLEKEVDILARKVNLLAEMFKDYVENESTAKLEAGKWYPEPIDTI